MRTPRNMLSKQIFGYRKEIGKEKNHRVFEKCQMDSEENLILEKIIK